MEEQQTIQLAQDTRRVEKILLNKNSDVVKLEYEGDKPGKPFRHKVKRAFNKFGFPLVAGQEIYGNPDNLMTEKRTFKALNELVRQRKAKIEMHEGLLWYVWVGDVKEVG